MEIRRYVMGEVMTNTYFLIEGKEAIIIDPACKAEKAISLLEGYELKGILLTHGHFDHLKAVDGLYRKYQVPVFLHKEDEFLARDKYAGAIFGMSAYISCPTMPIKEGKMSIGSFEFETIYTPGHTPGSVIYVFEDDIFTGDTLFHLSVGRTDLVGGNERILRDSLKAFRDFKKDYRIHPGHEAETTLEFELQYNPYL
ncbi:MAG: MBL fold metallo-hydrolase [Erysipelotrichaceae bacterium]|nr:MBL fold metallo-hydrolase [Erysipelotrichaceae bacterium]